MNFSHEQLVKVAPFSLEDMKQITNCRRDHNRLGFGYQLVFVRLTNRFPAQQPFEVLEDILTNVSIQLGIPVDLIHLYTRRWQTIQQHKERICNYLGLKRFGEEVLPLVKQFIFEEACHLERVSVLLARTELFLREHGILSPAEYTLRRLIANQREEARKYIFKKISASLSKEMAEKLDALLDTKEKKYSDLHFLKQSPGRSSPIAMLKLVQKLEQIQTTGILEIDIAWLNNNLQRIFTRHAQKYSSAKLRGFQAEHRYTALVCFLWQMYQDTVDQIIIMYDRLFNRLYNRAQADIDDHLKSKRKKTKKIFLHYKTLIDVIVEESVNGSIPLQKVYDQIDKEELLAERGEVNVWLTGKYSHVFNLLKDRFSYIRQFSPALVNHLQLKSEESLNSSLLSAMDILREMNEGNKRKLPENVPNDFIPKRMLPLVTNNGKTDKAAWECALLTAIRDEIKSGNLSVDMSKRFCRFDDFFIPKEKWNQKREAFFNRAGLPCNPTQVKAYLTKRLNQAYDQFLETLPHNTYVTIDEQGWHIKTDPGEQLKAESERKLQRLKEWLGQNMRMVKLAELLIEVENDLKITRFFMTASQQENPQIDDICAILATIMAHGCNIGTYTMSHLIQGISYSRLKHITDWQLTEETQRGALAAVVNAISNLDITQAWGTGKTSSSDGQRFALRRKVLQQTYSPKFNDFALEFYAFIADNFAPFYSMPTECTDRDAPFVLDGLLYNESDLALEEHYTDTHGYTENNFAAFAMLGKRFSPRIRGLHRQHIYRIDREKDYGPLESMVGRADRTIHLDWIVEQWDHIGHFYASLEAGHVTASTAMKRLNGFSGKNHFYRANRELGRVFKTEHILQYMSDQTLRQRTRRGLLKGEQIHALARDLNYGKRGRINQRDWQEQKNSCSCLTLILACIIYWQAKEINRVVIECNPESSQLDISLIEHVSPITWDNVILYGEYVIDRSLVKI